MPNPAARTIRLRWQGRCRVCGEDVAAGERARWDGAARTITCLACAISTTGAGEPTSGDVRAAARQRPPVAIGVAGGSALRVYERKRAARERRARERAGVLGVWLARLGGDPQSTRSWRTGGEGEVEVARRLTKQLDGAGVHLLHDRRAPGRARANIDHVAVGPGGVTVIDAKRLSGKVRVEARGGLFGPRRRQLLVGGRDRTRLVYGVRGQAEEIRSLLERHGIACEVRCALCFAEVEGLPWFQRLELEGVLIDGPRRVAKLARRPGPLGEEQVHRIVRLLAGSLPAA